MKCVDRDTRRPSLHQRTHVQWRDDSQALDRETRRRNRTAQYGASLLGTARLQGATLMAELVAGLPRRLQGAELPADILGHVGAIDPADSNARPPAGGLRRLTLPRRTPKRRAS